MLFFALSFAAGIVLFSLKNNPVISSLELTLFFAAFSLFLVAIYRQLAITPILGFFLLGFVWMGVFSHWVLSTKVAPDYLNRPLLVSGKIHSLAETTTHRTRFIFQSQQPMQAKLRLSWYEKNPPLPIVPGTSYQLLIKLKPNHGYQNPGGFDFERYLFAQRIDAIGYVRPSSENQLLTNKSNTSLLAIRHLIREKLTLQLSKFEFGGVLNALILGDRSLIKDQHWQRFIQTGTTHLSVVSGLHIGLVSGLMFYLSGLAWQRCTRCLLLAPKPVVAAYFGLASALAYALIAGLSTPTQRALIMAGVVFIALIVRRHHDIWQLYGLALFLVLLFNPLNVFLPGFWLSFYVVAVIIYATKQMRHQHWLWQLLYTQLLIAIATLPLLIYLFGQIAWSAPLANLIAVPLFAMVLMPLVLLATLLTLLNIETLANLAFAASNALLSSLYQYLGYLQSVLPVSDNQPQSPAWLMLTIALMALIHLPKKVRFLPLGLVSAMLLFNTTVARPAFGQARVTILDVGQGLAIAVQTQHHNLLFDTGAAYPSGFSLGEAVVTPYLKQQRIKALDMVVISHGDNDHLGGLAAIQAHFPIGLLLSSEPPGSTTAKSCRDRRQWVWDGVVFEMLNNAQHLSNNNASCVLKISSDKYSLLLTGDIEKKAERYLLDTLKDKLKSDILIVPHHGSNTSSSSIFLQQVKPRVGIVSSGLNNAFGHPAKRIQKRYQALGIPLINTACSGGIEVHLGDALTLQRYRQAHARYYWHRC